MQKRMGKKSFVSRHEYQMDSSKNLFGIKVIDSMDHSSFIQWKQIDEEVFVRFVFLIKTVLKFSYYYLFFFKKKIIFRDKLII